MGKVFNEWTIGECIGEGAFGRVYQITREDYGHTYYAALKVIEIPQSQSEVEGLRNDGMGEAEIEEYFQGVIEDIVSEFALMSELKGNSNIVSYEDHTVVKKKDGFGWNIYIRMELLTPLFTHIRQTKMTIRDVIQLGIDICTALEVCREYNIIHRDIKPENIFISKIGTYKLGDFGIARQLEKTSTGLSKKGTIPYMAPEVRKGTGYNSTVDLYSLGLVLYRFLNNNRLPFLPLPPKPVKHSDKERADYLRMIGQSLSAPCYAKGRLAEIVLKACAYYPKDRYETAAEMKADLSALLYTETEKNLIDLEMELPGFENKYEPKPAPSPAMEDPGTVHLFPDEEKDIPETAEKTEPVSPPVKLGTEIEKNRQEDSESGSLQRHFAFWEQMRTKAAVIVISVLVLGLLVCVLAAVISSKKPAHVNIDMAEKPAEIQATEIPPSEVPVTRQEAAKGEAAARKSATETDVSKEIQMVKMPNVLKKSKAKAKALLKKAGLKCKIKTAYSNSYKKGLVMKQSVSKGKQVKRGTTVTVMLSKGKKVKKAARVTPKPVVNTQKKTTQKKTTSQKTKSSTKKTKKKDDGWYNLDNKDDDGWYDLK